MLLGLMQDGPLLTTSIIAYAAEAHGAREIVSRTIDGCTARLSYAELYKRSGHAALALHRLGVRPGDRVATLGWNTHRHLELFYAVPGIGAILHTVNPRLFEPQIEYIINHGGAEVLFVDGNLAELVLRLVPALTGVRHYVLLSEPTKIVSEIAEWPLYEDLIEGDRSDFTWPSFDERAGACLCYTSGTTGAPKGVLYSHRSTVLHAMGSSLNGAFGYRAADCILPAASLYHAAGWAVPYTAPLNGAKLVLPADKLDGASLHELFESESVTQTSGVPTIWTNYLSYLDEHKLRPSSLKRVVVGGSALPLSMARTFRDRYDIEVLQAWGMTETSPVGVVSTATPNLDELPAEERQHVLWTKQGRRQFGVELRIVADDGENVPPDDNTQGALQVRGPWIVRRYFRDAEDALTADGWFDTGDVATLDRFGFIRLTDRRKDLIKSGGEWISSIELELLAEACDGVRMAAVIGVAHPKWEERPLLVVERQPDSNVSDEDVLAFMDGRVARWWRPDEVVFIETMPMTATGKVDKKQLRQQFGGHQAAHPDEVTPPKEGAVTATIES